MQTFTLAWQMDGQPHTYTVTAGRRCLIGRLNPSCDIVLPLAAVSRQHAVIDAVGETFYLWNLSQTNPVYFNEQTPLKQYQSMPLAPGDTFRVETVIFEVLQPVVRVFKLRCANCGRVIDYSPEAFCPWCGRALSNGDSIIAQS
ncbi:MAG TPA: FHA domain-containing protein [Ktedonobacterales bacterium]